MLNLKRLFQFVYRRLQDEGFWKVVKSEEELEAKWPGIKFAYDFVLPSYQWMIARFEAADSRIQTLQTFIVTMTFGLSAVLTAISEKGQLNFVSWPFITAIILALLAIIMGAIGRSLGGITLANPNVLYDHWLHKSEWSFKKDMVFFAGQHFKKNSETIRKKTYITMTMTILFLMETALLLFWIVFAKK